MNCPLRLRFLKFSSLSLVLGSLAANLASAQPAAPAADPSTAPTAEAAAPAIVPMTTVVPDGKVHKFETRDHQFWMDGQPTLLLTGEMHFGRVQPEDWETRIKQAKAMGLNAISFYLFWNQVESKEGTFDFSGMNDVRHVLKLCQDNGMWAILRPGPYCCAEVDYGGIPYWTLKYPDVKIRTNDPKYVEWSKKYIEQVYKQVGDLQVTKGGPLIMVAIENEYSNGQPTSNDYMVSLQKIFQDVGFDVPMFTCDPQPEPQSRLLPGVMAQQNGLSNRGGAQLLNDLGDFPVYVPEVYTAWFLGWGQKPVNEYVSRSPLRSIVTRLTTLLDNNYSFCLYMFFGGTNYGFNDGAVYFQSLVTSYEYGAPIDEAGRTTEKFRAIRDLLSTRTNRKLPEPPADPVVVDLPAIKFSEQEPLLSTLPAQPTKVADKTLSMEDLDQAYGFIDYRKKFDDGLKGVLELKNSSDYTIVMVNGKTVGEAYRGLGPDSSKITLNQDGPATLDILVYNLGRISVILNDRTQVYARKGLLGGAALDGKDLTGWEMYSLPYESGPGKFQAATASANGPAFYHSTFTVAKVGGTFLDMRNWSFGVVWINGHNLGRFWDRGPVRTLFVPGEWLKKGENDITVLELHDAPKTPVITSVANNIQEDAVTWSVGLTTPPGGGRGGAGFRGGRGGRGGFGGFGPGRGAGPGGPAATGNPASATPAGSATTTTPPSQ